MTLLEEFEKFEKLGIDASTCLLFNDCLYLIEEGEKYDSKLTENDNFRELLIYNCFEYEWDWTCGLGYEDCICIITKTISDYSIEEGED